MERAGDGARRPPFGRVTSPSGASRTGHVIRRWTEFGRTLNLFSRDGGGGSLHAVRTSGAAGGALKRVVWRPNASFKAKPSPPNVSERQSPPGPPRSSVAQRDAVHAAPASTIGLRRAQRKPQSGQRGDERRGHPPTHPPHRSRTSSTSCAAWATRSRVARRRLPSCHRCGGAPRGSRLLPPLRW